MNTDYGKTVLEDLIESKKTNQIKTIKYIKLLISLTSENSKIINYLSHLPPPTYYHKSFLHYISTTCQSFLSDTSQTVFYQFNRDKEELQSELKKILPDFLEKIQNAQNNNNINNNISKNKNYIIGKTESSALVNEKIIKYPENYTQT